MSYRGKLQRVFAETSLERKCRWWFGISLGLLIFLSFYWYGGRTERLVYEVARSRARQLVYTAYREAHEKIDPKLLELGAGNLGDATIPSADPAATDGLRYTYQSIMREGRRFGTDFRWDTVLPPNPRGLNPPQDDVERRLLAEYLAAKADTTVKPEPAADQDADEALAQDVLPPGIAPYDIVDSAQQRYNYYYPIYAQPTCVQCHKIMGGSAPRTDLQAGDLLAVMRISFDHGPTARDLAKNRALLWTAAIVTGILSMVALYFVVRYVIVWPVQHLRDVSNAVREGNVETRAEIYTGDEFEELAAAFNRMVRQLLRQQDELQSVNTELDGKLDELAQANMKLYEMNRLKSDFLATMSHELRTPLNSILGFSDVLSDIDALSDKQKRYVGNIQRSGRMLLDMINDILDLAKMESGRMDVRATEFSIQQILSAQCDMARPLAERKNIDVELQCEPDLPPLQSDPAKVQQIVNNLLSNAIKFTPEGGRITVSAHRDEGDLLRVTVADTGIGISEAEQSLVFEKFRQGAAALTGGDAMTREHSGTGLGLSIVRELCRLLGGDVSLSSVLGKGSTFTVLLPWTAPQHDNLDARLSEQVAVLTRPVSLDSLRTTTPVDATRPGGPLDGAARPVGPLDGAARPGGPLDGTVERFPPISARSPGE